ncbi:MAG TPA: hypothetical protein VFO76_07995, partial [Candidatus Kapabacteria bacterium]|nr:hypothetical protein [Candidatus Kapabacteria bacterium]
MKHLRIIFILLVLVTSPAIGQWKKVFDMQSLGSAAFFLNPSVGWIGTGNYPFGSLGAIFYTTNGGATWGRSFMPNMNLVGQVTDIYFVDSTHGWATIREAIEHGWSGLYRTFDGGQSWQLWYQTTFPIAIRQNSKGIFFTARLEGVQRSVDDGLSFQTILVNSGALGLDLDEKLGIVSSEATNTYNVTTDGGLSWHPFTLNQEAWGSFVDAATNSLFVSSERDNKFPGTSSIIASITPTGVAATQLFIGKGDELTGGIAGNKGCRSVIYVQKQSGDGTDGLLRSTDAGATWVPVRGPYNLNDKRFAVTGNGAVVYAFDANGGVWKTSN